MKRSILPGVAGLGAAIIINLMGEASFAGGTKLAVLVFVPVLAMSLSVLWRGASRGTNDLSKAVRGKLNEPTPCVKKQIAAISLLMMALGVATLSASGGWLDGILDSKEVKEAKNNDAWYAANKDKVAVKLKSISWTTNEASVRIVGSIENLTDEKISSILVDVIIVNKANNQEALRERMMISAPVFKSETYELRPLIRCLGESDLVQCLKRLKDFSWSYEMVTAIRQKSELDDISIRACANKYYKVRSFWDETK